MLLTQRDVTFKITEKNHQSVQIAEEISFLFCPILSVSEATHFVGLCSKRVIIRHWALKLETVVKILVIRGRRLLWIELVHLSKTSICRFVIHLWRPEKQVQLWASPPRSFLSRWYLKWHLPPGDSLSTEADRESPRQTWDSGGVQWGPGVSFS